MTHKEAHISKGQPLRRVCGAMDAVLRNEEQLSTSITTIAPSTVVSPSYPMLGARTNTAATIEQRRPNRPRSHGIGYSLSGEVAKETHLSMFLH